MEKIKKDEIITAAKQYMQRHGMSQKDLRNQRVVSFQPAERGL